MARYISCSNDKFKENEDLDHVAMERHFAFQIDAGVHGMVTGGSLGEASTLSFDKKLEVTKIALNVADKRIPVLANVSETRTTNTLHFVK